jgi:hypothetical protein
VGESSLLDCPVSSDNLIPGRADRPNHEHDFDIKKLDRLTVLKTGQQQEGTHHTKKVSGAI